MASMGGHGSFYWNELNTHEPEAARRFFELTIGWTFERVAMQDDIYLIAKQDGRPVGGIFELKGPAFEGVPSHWLAVLEVDDVDQRTALALAAGARIIRGPWDIAGVGRMVILADSTGAVMGWLKPAPDSPKA